MCQLLGMNAAEPTDFCFSFSGFARRGGESDNHADGWGLAIYKGRRIQIFIDHNPACNSPIAALISNSPMKTFNMISHIRYATKGSVELENVHPFCREMWGIQWCFAHNGDVSRFSVDDVNDIPALGKAKGLSEQTFTPIGDTDSEAIFCAILNALKSEFTTLPTLDVLYDTIKSLCCEIINEEEGAILNFLMGCGQYTQFAYSWPGSRPGSKVWNGLHYTIRHPPFTTAKLADLDYTVDFEKVTDNNDRVAVIATKPLTTDENWHEFKRGNLVMFDKGVPYSIAYDCAEVEKAGRGLKTKWKRKLQDLSQQ